MEAGVERGELVLEAGAILARLPDETVREMRRALALPGGADELAALLGGLYRLDAETRAALVTRLNGPVRLRVADG